LTLDHDFLPLGADLGVALALGAAFFLGAAFTLGSTIASTFASVSAETSSTTAGWMGFGSSPFFKASNALFAALGHFLSY
jgi:hypothetical protein